ncbi:hypothetical protein ACIQJT_41470 [Streptomyces sp. NPDC091972]|uniref:hypothetical protein n=1 Tax=Streptomyces sp. NPDC091972 TaxID=3366007 RepID=UPI0037FDA04B
MSGLAQNSPAESNSRLFTITWFIGITFFTYLLGVEFQLPEPAETVREWAFFTSLTGLAGCLFWFAGSATKGFLTPRTIKVLDAIGRGIEKLKKTLGGGNANDPTGS